MQLSTSSSSTETNLAALLLGGTCSPAQAGAALTTGTSPGGLDFSQFLPESGSESPAAPAAGAGAPIFSTGGVPVLSFVEGVANADMTASPQAGLPASGVAEQASETAPVVVTDGKGAVDGSRSGAGKKRAVGAETPSGEIGKPARKPAAGKSERMDTMAVQAVAPFVPQTVPTELPPVEFDPAASEGETPSEDEAVLLNPAGHEMPQASLRALTTPGRAAALAHAAFRFAESAPATTPDTGAEIEGAEVPATLSQEPTKAIVRHSLSLTPPAGGETEVATHPAAQAEIAETLAAAQPEIVRPFETPRRREFALPAAAVSLAAEATPVQLPAADTANIAVRAEKNSRDGNVAVSAFGKSFLNASGKRVTSHLTDLGIGVAETAVNMSAAFQSSRQSSLQTIDIPAAAGVESGKSNLEFSAPAEVTTSNAHRAVAEVLHVAERVLSRDQSAVNIQFSIGGEDLSVRVEMRANEVHATFRTDSAELRAALSQEWQQVNSQGGERSLRIAAPVFAGADSNAFSSSSGDTPSQQRDAQAQRAGHEFMTAASGRSSSASSATPVAVAPTPRVWAANSLHLHTLA